MAIQFIVSLIVLALLGIIDSAYLAWTHFMKKQLVCPIDGCEVVVESKWNKIFFVRNEILGLMFYIAVLIGAILLFQGSSIKIWLVIISGIGLLFSAFLVYVQARIIKSYCFYCLISALITLLIFLNLLML
ncbi:hypothetical protein HYV49_02765 [Candidatus Pacearchaeota archaeon]|nr:hypothetical protein [Candidatus Pacearchaeota archaeon]